MASDSAYLDRSSIANATEVLFFSVEVTCIGGNTVEMLAHTTLSGPAHAALTMSIPHRVERGRLSLVSRSLEPALARGPSSYLLCGMPVQPSPAVEEGRSDDAPIDGLGDNYSDDTPRNSQKTARKATIILTLTRTWQGLGMKTGKSQNGVGARIRRCFLSLLIAGTRNRMTRDRRTIREIKEIKSTPAETTPRRVK